jgi:mycothiol synthase
VTDEVGGCRVNSLPDLTVTRLGTDDVDLIASIHNATMPEDTWVTEEQVRIGISLDRPDDPPLRVVARLGEQPVAFGHVGQNMFSSGATFRFSIMVMPEFRRRGIAKWLYEELVAFAVERNASAIRVDIHEHCLPPIDGWLEREGYREVERMRPSELRLDTLDFDSWAAAERKVEAHGLALTTLAAEDSPENRRKLWEVSERVRPDIPHSGPSDPFPFEQFDGLMNRPEARPYCLVIAKDGDAYVGLTLLVHQTPEQALTGFTGVLPEYRGRGIAVALKVHCARLAREYGYSSMRTYNHVNNPAMLSVNDRLGYVPLPHEILFEKRLHADGQ